jgi:hypothetical protein
VEGGSGATAASPVGATATSGRRDRRAWLLRYLLIATKGEERAMPDDHNATAAAICEVAKQVDHLGNAIAAAATMIATAIATGERQ